MAYSVAYFVASFIRLQIRGHDVAEMKASAARWPFSNKAYSSNIRPRREIAHTRYGAATCLLQSVAMARG